MMSKTLTEIAQELVSAPQKAILIYAFNGVGKTRLSREFKELIAPKRYNASSDLKDKQILYYSSFTEDLFYWDNDLDNDNSMTLKIHPNAFTDWVFAEQGLQSQVIDNFKHYHFGSKLEVDIRHADGEIVFSYRNDDGSLKNDVKISKGEESNFIWSIFFTLIQQVVDELNVDESERSTDKFNKVKYIFIDDPVSSLDENHLIQLAVDIAQMIRTSTSDIRFIITTHNPLFFNVMYNEFTNGIGSNKSYRLEKLENGMSRLVKQKHDSPFAYQVYLKSQLEHLFKEEISSDAVKDALKDDASKNLFTQLLKPEMTRDELNQLYQLLKDKIDEQKINLQNLFFSEIACDKRNGKQFFQIKFFREKSIEKCQVEKYHFNFMRNILEKTATFLGYRNFEDVLPNETEDSFRHYAKRIINLSSHAKHSAEETNVVLDNDKRVLKYVLDHLNETYGFRKVFVKLVDD